MDMMNNSNMINQDFGMNQNIGMMNQNFMINQYFGINQNMGMMNQNFMMDNQIMGMMGNPKLKNSMEKDKTNITFESAISGEKMEKLVKKNTSLEEIIQKDKEIKVFLIKCAIVYLYERKEPFQTLKYIVENNI